MLFVSADSDSRIWKNVFVAMLLHMIHKCYGCNALEIPEQLCELDLLVLQIYNSHDLIRQLCLCSYIVWCSRVNLVKIYKQIELIYSSFEYLVFSRPAYKIYIVLYIYTNHFLVFLSLEIHFPRYKICLTLLCVYLLFVNCICHYAYHMFWFLVYVPFLSRFYFYFFTLLLQFR